MVSELGKPKQLFYQTLSLPMAGHIPTHHDEHVGDIHGKSRKTAIHQYMDSCVNPTCDGPIRPQMVECHFMFNWNASRKLMIWAL